MNKLFLLLILVTLGSCARKTTVAVEVDKPRTTAEILKTAKVDKYMITSPYGHEFAVEVTRFEVGEQGYNNTCKVNYIVTNTGNKDFRYREAFANSSNRSMMDSNPAIVFEFVTGDGKRIQKTEFFYDDILAGRSSEVRDMSIDVGLRNCDGEVKPVALMYKSSK